MTTGLCEGPGGADGGVPGGDGGVVNCTAGETGAPCAAAQICVGGHTCEATCTDATCLANQEVCNQDPADSAFNDCDSPDGTAVCEAGCVATCPTCASAKQKRLQHWRA